MSSSSLRTDLRCSPQQKLWLVCCIAVVLVFWSMDTWWNRFALSPDGISYIDLARQVAAGHPGVVLHPYWSPLYPFSLGCIFSVFSATASTERQLLHLLNWFCCLLCLASFTLFLLTWYSRQMAGFSKLRFRAFTALSYGALWLSCVTLMNPNRSQPDVLVQAFVFLDLALVHRLMTSRKRVAVVDSVALGLCLGLGFYLKSAMLPTGAFLILIASFLLWRRSRSLVSMLVASAIFAVVVAPFVLALSRHMGRLTIGDSGRLNYAWSVNGVSLWVGWTGSPGDGMPIHGPRVLSAEPKVLEFAAPVPGTYPLWYNPSYWHEGVKTPYHLSRQARSIKASLVFLGGLLLELSPFCVGFALLWFLRSRKSSVNRTRAAILFGLVVCTMGMYGLVIYEKRYVAPFVVILIIELARMLAVRTSAFRFAAMCTVVVAVTFLPLGFRSVRHLAGSGDVQPGRMDYAIAGSVRSNGLAAGDQIAFVGPAMLHQGWAQVANLRITVQFFDETAFWRLGDQERANWLKELKRAGPKAIVAVAPRSVSVAGAWVALPSPSNGDRIYLLAL